MPDPQRLVGFLRHRGNELEPHVPAKTRGGGTGVLESERSGLLALLATSDLARIGRERAGRLEMGMDALSTVEQNKIQ